MIDLTTEQQQLAIIVHDDASRFPQTENGDAQLLQGCYDYMDAFKRVMDSASKVQMAAISGVLSLCKMDGTTGTGDC